MNKDLKNIEKIFGKVTPVDAHYVVRATAKIYPDRVKIFTPYQPYRKKIPFMEERIDGLDGLVEDWETDINISQNKKEDNYERSLRRTRTLLTDLVLSNDFNMFGTLTFNPSKSDRTNPQAVKTQMGNWLRNQRKRNGKFNYILVPEFHKDGEAIHFHALFNDYPGQLIDSGKRKNGNVLYNIRGYTLGFTSLEIIRNKARVSSYIQKYIKKDMTQLFGKRRFWASTGLNRPQIVDNPDPDAWYMRATPDWTCENEYGRIFLVNSSISAPESHNLTEDSPEPVNEEEEV
jgi:hypothetical protein